MFSHDQMMNFLTTGKVELKDSTAGVKKESEPYNNQLAGKNSVKVEVKQQNPPLKSTNKHTNK